MLSPPPPPWIVSPPCVALIESAPLPVWIVCAAVPVAVTVSAPVSPLAARLPPTLSVALWTPVSVSVSPEVIPATRAGGDAQPHSRACCDTQRAAEPRGDDIAGEVV